MWFDKRAVPRAYINEWILIFFNIIDLLQLFIIPQSVTTAAQWCATNGQAEKNSQSCRRNAFQIFLLVTVNLQLTVMLPICL